MTWTLVAQIAVLAAVATIAASFLISVWENPPTGRR